MDFNHEKDHTSALPATSEQKELLASMYDLCDVLRHAGFTVQEMFAGFDRNGSGEISVSEFCSLLRVMLGRSVDKKIIYRLMYSIDTDGGKSVSIQEISQFIFYVWRAQLRELAQRVYLDTTLDDKALRALVKEKDDIKNAIIRNFPRSWRDKVSSLKIDSPFTNLFAQGEAGAGTLGGGTGGAWNRGIKAGSVLEKGVPNSPVRCRSRSPSSNHRNKLSTLKDGPNNTSSLKMLQMRKQQDAIPYREGMRLGIFPVSNINDVNDVVSRANIQDAFNVDVTR